MHKAEGVTLDQAAMVEFLAIGAHAVRRAQVRAGQRVLVVGAGPIGMGAMVFSRLRGATVVALDSRADRLAFCTQRLGTAASVALGTATSRSSPRSRRTSSTTSCSTPPATPRRWSAAFVSSPTPAPTS